MHCGRVCHHNPMLVVPAYAKLNLSLEIRGKLPGGWHDLDSLVVLISIRDLVGISLQPSHRNPSEPGPPIQLTGPFASQAPADATNLAAQALRLGTAGRQAEGELQVSWLHKRIPARAGLGGGSSDAASVLFALAPPERFSTDELLSLGSDVPLFQCGTAVRIRGRGEKVVRVRAPAIWFAIAVAGTVDTGAAFGMVQPADLSDGSRTTRLVELLARGEVDPSLMGSALERAAIATAPEIGAKLKRLRQDGASWAVTGSGGAVFLASSKEAEAREACRKAQALGLPAWVAQALGYALAGSPGFG